MIHEQPIPIREALGYLDRKALASAASQAPREPKVYSLPDSVLDDGIPPEYRGAVLPDEVREDLHGCRTGVYLHGAPGTGKTRIAWAMIRAHRAKRMTAELAGVSVDQSPTYDHPKGLGHTEWCETMVKRMRSGDRVRVIGECADIVRHRHNREWLDEQAQWPGWLVVDDIGFQAKPSAWAEEAIYHLANERRAHYRPTLWTSNLDPDQLAKTYGAAIASRLTGGRVIDLGGKDRRQEGEA